ncbi:MAG: Lrp/AsnC family transcriptional regulator [Gammaproteobacteria bacterium]|nr:Lrp/AsnC family transcriptional regulator [Gammaproteobacteria bacterium]
MRQQIKLDKFDLRILRELQLRADLSVADLGERIGLSHTPCWRRIRRLEDAGVIRARVTLLDPRLLNLDVNVFAQVTLTRHDEETLERFEEAVQDVVEVVECHTLSGDRDFLLRIVVGDVSDYERLLKTRLVHLPGVASVSSTFALKQVKYTTVLPV